MKRMPLPTGYSITMPNKGEYIIDELINRGGFSLVYLAHTKGEDTKVVLKEFFPVEYAFRDLKKNSPTYNKVIPISGEYETVFESGKRSFDEKEGRFGGSLWAESSQVVAFAQSGNGYAVLPRFSADMYSVLDIVQYWENNSIETGEEIGEQTPRLSVALKIIDSLLDVLDVFHTSKNALHLDLSATNVLFATKDLNDVRNGRTYLTDFGSCVEMKNGIYIPKDSIPFSEGYSAPEIMHLQPLNVQSDIYSVGAILYLLCVGKSATIDWKLQKITSNDIEYEINDLKVSKQVKKVLISILEQSCNENIDERYNNVRLMQNDIQDLQAILHCEKLPQVYCSEVKPITENYVRHPKCVIKKIENALHKFNICFVQGMSGVGKSELIRQYAEEKCQNIPVLEIYFPEESCRYEIVQILTSLEFRHLKDKNSMEEKQDVLDDFLKQEILLLIHNFNYPDLDFIYKYFKKENVKILVSTQCTSEQLRQKKIDLSSMVQLEPRKSFGVQIFKQVYKSYRKKLPGTPDEIRVLSELLFNLPILINTVAMQLVNTRREKFHYLINALLHKNIDYAFIETPTVEYQRDNLEERITGTPFEIVCQIIQGILPPIEELEKQCLQIITKMPNEWIEITDLAEILGDSPDDLRYDKANSAIKELIRKHLLQEKHRNGKDYVNIHAMLANVMCSEINSMRYLENISLDFLQHLERNVFISEFDVVKGEKRNRTEFLNETFTKFNHSKILANLKKWCIKEAFFEREIKNDSIFSDELLNQAFQKIGLPSSALIINSRVGNFNQPQYVDVKVESKCLFFEEVVIYYDTGVVVLNQCKDDDYNLERREGFSGTRRFEIFMEVSNQLKESYYQKKKQKFNEEARIKKGRFCSVRIHYNTVYKNLDVFLPDSFMGTPISKIEYFDNTISDDDTGLTPYFLKIGKECKIIKGTANYAKSIELNNGIREIDLECENLTEWDLPESVERIEEKCLHAKIQNITISPYNKFMMDKDGLIYTRDGTRLLFIPKHKRTLHINVLMNVRYINTSCLEYQTNFELSNMSIYELERLVKKQNFTILERQVLEHKYWRYCEYQLNDIIKAAKELLDIYQDYTKDLVIPYYLKYFVSANTWNSFWWNETNISANAIDMKIEMKIDYIKQFIHDDFLKQINPLDFQEITDLLLDEELTSCFRGSLIQDVMGRYFWNDRYLKEDKDIGFDSIKIYLTSPQKLKSVILSIKEQYECVTLRQVCNKRNISSDALIDELVQMCNI